MRNVALGVVRNILLAFMSVSIATQVFAGGRPDGAYDLGTIIYGIMQEHSDSMTIRSTGESETEGDLTTWKITFTRTLKEGKLSIESDLMVVTKEGDEPVSGWVDRVQVALLARDLLIPPEGIMSPEDIKLTGDIIARQEREDTLIEYNEPKGMPDAVNRNINSRTSEYTVPEVDEMFDNLVHMPEREYQAFEASSLNLPRFRKAISGFKVKNLFKSGKDIIFDGRKIEKERQDREDQDKPGETGGIE